MKAKTIKAVFLKSAGIARWSRLSRARLVIAIVIISCPRIISASSYYRADESRESTSEPKPFLATGGSERALVDAFARLPLRFEACASRTPARYGREPENQRFIFQQPKRRCRSEVHRARGGLVAARIWDYHGMQDRLKRTSSFLNRAATERPHARAARN